MSLDLLNFRVVSCCLCGDQNSRPFCNTVDRLHGVPGTFSYVQCIRCGIIYQNPQVEPADVHQLYPPEYSPWDSPPTVVRLPGWKRKLRDLITITGLPRFVRDRLSEASSLLDVGCGNGKFMARVVADHPSCRVEGLDFSGKAAEAARETGFQVHLGTLPELAPTLPQYDVVSMWWYLEHLHDPEEALRLCHQLLHPGGYLCCGVPNEHSVGRRVFRGYWYHLDPPRHLWIFSPGSLRALLERVGFEVVYVKHDYSAWGILGSLQYLLRGKRSSGVSWVGNPLLKAAFRPAGVLQGLMGLGDTFAIYARRKEESR